MKVLVTGCRGQLGQDVCKRLAALDVEYDGVDIDDFDLTDAEETERCVVRSRPDAIIHCAAYTAVDKAEEASDLCFSVNEKGTFNLAKAAADLGTKIVYLSTDYVFDGAGSLPHKEEDPTNPLNVYGASKLAGERAILSQTERCFIVRTSWVFGIHGRNFVETMLRLGEQRDSVSVVCDQIGSPTYTVDLARLLCSMIFTEKYGIYHAANEGFCSWYDLACRTMELAGRPCRVLPINSAEYPTKAKRPLNSRLSKDKLTENGFERLPPWQDALERFLKERKDF